MLKSMLHHLREARAQELEGEGAGEAGFTLIELMVVLLIIAILLAIAIPTFLGVTSGANDRAAQSNLTNALTESAAIYQNQGQAYPDPGAASCNGTGTTSCYTQSAPEFTWVAGATASTAQNTISVNVIDITQGGATDGFVSGTDDSQGVEMAVLSKTNTCWYIVSLQAAPTSTGALGDTGLKSAGTFYGQTKNVASGGCKATNIANTNVTGTSYSNASAV